MVLATSKYRWWLSPRAAANAASRARQGTSAPTLAYAQDSAGAEALFQSGHQLFEAKRYGEACPKFAESFRLDGTRFVVNLPAASRIAAGDLRTGVMATWKAIF